MPSNPTSKLQYPENFYADLICDDNACVLCHDPNIILEMIDRAGLHHKYDTEARNILYLRYHDKVSLRDIGKMYGISGSRVQQLICRYIRVIQRQKDFANYVFVRYSCVREFLIPSHYKY